MEPIHVFVSCRLSAEQLARVRSISPRLVIHGEPGGYAIMHSSEVDYKGIDYPEERPDIDVEGLVRQAEVVIATRIPANFRERAPRLRWLQLTSAGIDHLWKPWLDDGKIVVTSAKGMHGDPMAEFVFASVLFFAKGVRRMVESARAHKWDRFIVDEILGKTMILVGIGGIGGVVARRAKQFGMRTIAVRRKAGREGLPMEVDELVQVEAWRSVLGRGDYIVNSLPLTDRTQGMFDAAAFNAMKPSAIFINVGRGGSVDQAALTRALKEGRIAGAALDVFENEPLPADSALWDLQNVLISPHMGADTAVNMTRFNDVLCENLRRYALGEPLRNVVDPKEHY
jgi:D-2-hydroxyacid dehydrogenase (NADP+)